jgi:hypothetical protein
MLERGTSVSFHFYGLDLRLQSGDKGVVENVRRDFSYFEAQVNIPQVNIEVFEKSPPFGSLPDLKASVYATNYICYRRDGDIFTDYFGQGLRVFNHQTNNYQIFSESAALRHEISYLTILSAVGQFLDSKHIHRVHALGVSQNGKAILVLLPMRGGKTTLALQLLQSGQVKLLSEDSPLITQRGEVLPFPLRIGVVPDGELNIPAKYLRTMNMMEFGSKILIDIGYFADKISSACQPGVVLLGERALGYESRIEPASRLSAGKEFMKNAVVGLGLHQGIEYLLGRSLWETLGKTGLFFSRLNSSLKVISRSKVYRYVLGHDPERNHQVLLDFLQNLKL